MDEYASDFEEHDSDDSAIAEDECVQLQQLSQNIEAFRLRMASTAGSESGCSVDEDIPSGTPSPGFCASPGVSEARCTQPESTEGAGAEAAEAHLRNLRECKSHAASVLQKMMQASAMESQGLQTTNAREVEALLGDAESLPMLDDSMQQSHIMHEGSLKDSAVACEVEEFTVQDKLAIFDEIQQAAPK